MPKVVITSETPWKGTVGELQDEIPGMGMYNVLVKDDLRLALKPEEFNHPNSWKVGCKDRRDCPTWSYNALRFPTYEAAEEYGNDLASRWMALVAWEVHPSDDQPNR